MSVQIPMETASPQRKKPVTIHPSFWTNVRDYFSEYTNVTGLHGLRYIGEQNRPKFERILWFIIVNVSLALCIFYILLTYRKWDDTPVIVTFSHTQMPVWKIPFPTVTICPETKFSQFFNFTLYYNKYYENEWSNRSDEEWKFFAYSTLLCNDKNAGIDVTIEEDFFLFAKETTPLLEEIIPECFTLLGCKSLLGFSTVITEVGVCYSFNALDRNDIYESDVHHSKYLPQPKQLFKIRNWTFEKGYVDSVGSYEYPRRVMSAGIENGLGVSLRAFEDALDNICRTGDQGFKVILHHPGEIALVSMHYIRVPLDEDVLIAIRPEVITTSHSLRNYDPHKRGCYFSNERQLRYYKIYNQQNCQMECLTNYTLESCNCVLFYMPRVNTTRLCGSRNLWCTEFTKFKVSTMSKFNQISGDCDCLPSCTAITYNAEISQANNNYRNFRGHFSSFRDPVSLERKITSKVSIFFKEMQFVTSERHELYGTTDFLANCGGLLGLFTGFSLLSLVEILYFVTIRLCVNWRKYGRRYWSGSENLLQNKTCGYEK